MRISKKDNIVKLAGDTNTDKKILQRFVETLRSMGLDAPHNDESVLKFEGHRVTGLQIDEVYLSLQQKA